MLGRENVVTDPYSGFLGHFPRLVTLFWQYRGWLVALFFSFGAVAPCAATGLAWNTVTVEKTAVEGASSIDAVFQFSNSSLERVRVLSVETSCGCTTASLAKMDYAPGEHGELKVTLNLLGRSGIQEKTISVSTNDAPGRPSVLTLRVKIPALFDISPRLLWWVADETPQEKQTTIRTNAGERTKVLLLEPTDGNVHLRLQQAADGVSYVLGVTPASTRVKFIASIGLTIEAAGHPRQTATVYAQVR
jgi:Protein of unknown function (DUF1573)